MSNYVNRKFRTADSSFWTWLSTGSPDPAMGQTTPPFAKSGYSDHVVLEVLCSSTAAVATVSNQIDSAVVLSFASTPANAVTSSGTIGGP